MPRRISKATLPDWGFSSSPLVIDDVVVVAVAGQLAAYDRATGKQRWMGPVHGGSYASPHLMTLGGVAQILQGSGIGVDQRRAGRHAALGAPMVGRYHRAAGAHAARATC